MVKKNQRHKLLLFPIKSNQGVTLFSKTSKGTPTRADGRVDTTFRARMAKIAKLKAASGAAPPAAPAAPAAPPAPKTVTYSYSNSIGKNIQAIQSPTVAPGAVYIFLMLNFKKAEKVTLL